MLSQRMTENSSSLILLSKILSQDSEEITRTRDNSQDPHGIFIIYYFIKYPVIMCNKKINSVGENLFSTRQISECCKSENHFCLPCFADSWIKCLWINIAFLFFEIKCCFCRENNIVFFNHISGLYLDRFREKLSKRLCYFKWLFLSAFKHANKLCERFWMSCISFVCSHKKSIDNYAIIIGNDI